MNLLTIAMWLFIIWMVVGMVRSTMLRNYLVGMAKRVHATYITDIHRARTVEDFEAIGTDRWDMLSAHKFSEWMYISLAFWRPFESFVPRELLEILNRYEADKGDEVLSASEVV